jgi:tetratricopeptide (TPR) repeat protein
VSDIRRSRGRNLLIGIAVLVLFSVIRYRPAVGQVPDRQNAALAKPLISAGIDAYNQGDYQTAVNDLTRAQSLVPWHSPTALYLGLAYLKLGNQAEAITAWQTYISLQPYTETEKQNNVKDTVTRDLTILQKDQDRAQADDEISRERQLGPGDPNTIAITYYRNLGSPDLIPLQKGLTALVIADVSKVPNLKIVERERMQVLLDEMKLGSSGLVDPQSAARTGHLLGAGRVVTGSYVDPAKGELRVDSVVAQTGSARVVGNEAASGQTIQFYDIEKQLSAAILKDLGYSEAQLKAEGVWQVVQTPQTTNLPAFKAFSRGLDAKDQQDYANARTLFRQALTYDPDFEAARRELRHTPLAPMAIAQISSSAQADAPSAAQAVAGLEVPSKNVVPPLPPAPVVPRGLAPPIVMLHTRSTSR